MLPEYDGGLIEIAYGDTRSNVVGSRFDLTNDLEKYARVLEPYLSEGYYNAGKWDLYEEGKGGGKWPKYDNPDRALLLLGLRQEGFLARFKLKPIEWHECRTDDGFKFDSLRISPTYTLYHYGLVTLSSIIEVTPNRPTDSLIKFSLKTVRFEKLETGPYSWVTRDKYGEPITTVGGFALVLFNELTAAVLKPDNVKLTPQYTEWDSLILIDIGEQDPDTIRKELGLPLDPFDASGSWVRLSLVDSSRTLVLIFGAKDYLIGGLKLSSSEYSEYILYLYDYILSGINAAKTLNRLVRERNKEFQAYKGRKSVRFLSKQLFELNEYENSYLYLREFSNMVSPAVQIAIRLIDLKGMFKRVYNVEESLRRWDTMIKRAFEVESFKRAQFLNIFIIILTVITVILGCFTVWDIFFR